MPIEIKELIIRATVEETRGEDTETSRDRDTDSKEKKDCCTDDIEMIIEMIKAKKER